MKLILSRRATREFDQVFGYIEQHNPQGACNVERRIWATLSLLLQHPLSGPEIGVRGLRRFVVVPYPYVIYYLVRHDDVIVASIRHAARRPV